MNSLDIKQDISLLAKEAKLLIESHIETKTELSESELNRVKDIRKSILEKKEMLKNINEELNKNINKINRSMKKNFYLAEAIKAAVNGGYNELNEDLSNIFNESSEEFKKAELSRDKKSFVIPFNMLNEDATNILGPIDGNELNATLTATQGKSTIHTQYGPIVSPVQNENVLGVFDWFTGARGTFEVPRYGSTRAYWKSELAKADPTTMVYDGIQAKPKRLTAYVDISRQLLIQSSENIEAYVRDEMNKSIYRKLQETIFGDAAGAEDKPQGLFYNATTKSTFSFADLVNIEKEAKKNNVTGQLSYVINPDLEAQFRTTLKSEAAGARYLMEDGYLIGQNTVVSNDAKGLLFGDLKQILIVVWGPGIVLNFNPYTLDQYDAYRFTIHFYVDVINRAPLKGEGADATAAQNIFAYKSEA